VMSRLHRARKVLQLSLRDQAVALGIVAADETESRAAAAGHPCEPLDLQEYRRRKRGTK